MIYRREKKSQCYVAEIETMIFYKKEIFKTAFKLPINRRLLAIKALRDLSEAKV